MREGWSFPLLKEITEEGRGSAALNHAQNYELWSVPSFSVGHPEIVKGRSILSAKRPVEAGDVLLCKINPRINRVWVVGDNEALPKVASTEWIVLRPKSRNLVSPRWLQLYLSSSAFRSWIVGEISGATGSHTRAKPREVMCQKIPLPPIPEQNRIVAILDEAFAGIATAVANTEKNLANARELFESYLNAVFSQRGEGWTERPLETLVHETCTLSYGIVQPGSDVSGGLPVVRPTDLTEKVIRLQKLKTIDPSLAKPYSRTTLHGGDLLLCVRGTTGVVSIAARELRSANVTRGIVPIRFNPSLVDQELGYYLLRSPNVQEQITEKTYGAALMQINIRDVRKIRIPVPPRDTHEELRGSLDDLSAEATRLKLVYIQKLNALAELKQSLLQKAFSGELTATPKEEIETALA